MKKETRMIWSKQVDEACEKYFIQNIKSDDEFVQIIYPSLLYCARWQIKKSMYTIYIDMDQSDIEQELVSYIVHEIFPKYDKTKRASWFSVAALYMGYKLSNLSKKDQQQGRDARITINLEDLTTINEHYELNTGTGLDHTRTADKEFLRMLIDWWKTNGDRYFQKNSFNREVSHKLIGLMEDVLNDKNVDFYYGKVLGRRKILPPGMFTTAAKRKYATHVMLRLAAINRWLFTVYDETGKLPEFPFNVIHNSVSCS